MSFPSANVAEFLSVLGRPSRAERRIALAAAALVVAVTLLAMPFSATPGPRGHYVLAAVGICWIVADLLTAILLISQFGVSGTRYLAWVGAAYLVASLLAIPFFFYFPGALFPVDSMPLGMRQISPWLWWSRNVTFAILVAAATLRDPTARRRINLGEPVRRMMATTIALAIAGPAALTAALVTCSAKLPVLLDGSTFTPLYAHVAVPVAVVISLASFTILIVRNRSDNALRMWLSVALLAALLDVVLDIGAPGRFTIGWYATVFDTVGSAVIVLVAILAGFLRSFFNVNELARFDALTGLRNRRTFDEYVVWSLDYVVSRNEGIALAMIDIDHFKAFNDRYGHAEGDVCLRRVADAIRVALPHAYQVAARYGGEEFVVLLPGASPVSALAVANALLENVERLAIPNEGSPIHPHVTISIGVAFAESAQALDPKDLFTCADAALYEAKHGGRNTHRLQGCGSSRRPGSKVTYLREA